MSHFSHQCNKNNYITSIYQTQIKYIYSTNFHQSTHLQNTFAQSLYHFWYFNKYWIAREKFLFRITYDPAGSTYKFTPSTLKFQVHPLFFVTCSGTKCSLYLRSRQRQMLSRSIAYLGHSCIPNVLFNKINKTQLLPKG